MWQNHLPGLCRDIPRTVNSLSSIAAGEEAAVAVVAVAVAVGVVVVVAAIAVVAVAVVVATNL